MQLVLVAEDENADTTNDVAAPGRLMAPGCMHPGFDPRHSAKSKSCRPSEEVGQSQALMPVSRNNVRYEPKFIGQFHPSVVSGG